MEIGKDEFKTMTAKAQMIVIYDSINVIENKIDIICKKIEKKKIINSVYAFTGGVVGGFVALISKWLMSN